MFLSKLVSRCMLLCILLLVFTEGFQSLRRYRHWRPALRPNHRPPSSVFISECENCFTSDKCLGGPDEEISIDCNTCLRDECETSFSSRNGFGISCLGEAWTGACNESCIGSWDEAREISCKSCVRKCLYVRSIGNDRECIHSQFIPCQSCFRNDACFNNDEIREVFTEFCRDYILISCKKNLTSDCIHEAVMSSCSQCNFNQTITERLENCTSCLDSCNVQGQCVYNCSVNQNYPQELSCPTCSAFCKYQGRGVTRKFRRFFVEDTGKEKCNVSDTTCPQCAECDACVASCSDEFDRNHDFPNPCQCPGARLFSFQRRVSSVFYRPYYTLTDFFRHLLP